MGRRRRAANEPAWDGFLIIDKPAGWTSHDVVGRLRSLLKIRRIGHAGTLDPDATGVLVCGVGKGTRLLTYLTGADKEYSGVVRLGASTVTDDASGDVLTAPGCEPLDDSALIALDAALTELTGPILQVPSAVSAIKVGGRRAHDVVRSGQAPELVARPVTVYELRRTSEPAPTALNLPGAPGLLGVEFDIDVTCSSGTYVRALARDVGKRFGGGHLGALRRTRVGPFTLAEAVKLDDLNDLIDLIDSDDLDDMAAGIPGLPLGAAARRFLPWVAVDSRAATDLAHGRTVTLAAEPHAPASKPTKPTSMPTSKPTSKPAPNPTSDSVPVHRAKADEDQRQATDELGDLVALVPEADPDQLLAIARRSENVYAPVAVFADPDAGLDIASGAGADADSAVGPDAASRAGGPASPSAVEK